MVVYVFELARSRTHGQAPAVGVRFAARYRGAGHFPGRIGAGRRLLAQRGSRRGLRQPVVTRAVCERCVSTAHVVGRQHQHAATSCCTVRLHGQPDCHGNSSKTRLQQHSPQVMPSALGYRLSSLLRDTLFCSFLRKNGVCSKNVLCVPLGARPPASLTSTHPSIPMRRALLQAAVATSMVAGALGFAAPVAPLSRCALQLSCPLLGKSSLPRLRAPQRSCRRGHA